MLEDHIVQEMKRQKELEAMEKRIQSKLRKQGKKKNYFHKLTCIEEIQDDTELPNIWKSPNIERKEENLQE